MATFERDASHWLFRLSPDEWVRAGLAEIRRAEAAYERGDVRAGLAGARRAGGMALNAVVILEPARPWGRSYVEHVAALRDDPAAPSAVRAAAATLLDAPAPSPGIVVLRTKASAGRVVEAARDVIAHAYTIVCRSEPSP